MGTRMAEIQDLTDPDSWQYIETNHNPADDITRGKTLLELAAESSWNQGPPFLSQPIDQWTQASVPSITEPEEEIKRSAFCGLTVSQPDPIIPDVNQFKTFPDYLKATVQLLHGAAARTDGLSCRLQGGRTDHSPTGAEKELPR